MKQVAWLMGGRPGLGELILVLAVLLLLFGAKRLPELARAIGKSLSEFRKGREEGEKESSDAAARKGESPPAPDTRQSAGSDADPGG